MSSDQYLQTETKINKKREMRAHIFINVPWRFCTRVFRFSHFKLQLNHVLLVDKSKKNTQT